MKKLTDILTVIMYCVLIIMFSLFTVNSYYELSTRKETRKELVRNNQLTQELIYLLKIKNGISK